MKDTMDKTFKKADIKAIIQEREERDTKLLTNINEFGGSSALTGGGNKRMMISERENLKLINLSKNQINFLIARDLGNFLLNYVCLEELYLSNAKLVDETFSALIPVFENLHFLQVLDLSHNNITHIGMESFQEFFISLSSSGKSKPYIKGSTNDDMKLLDPNRTYFNRQLTIKLNFNPLGDKGIHNLCANITENTIHLHLYLERTQFEILGFESLCNLLYKADIPIRTLSIANNFLNDEIIFHNNIGESIKKNEFINRLIINKNQISKKGLKYIFDTLTENKAIPKGERTVYKKIFKKNFKAIIDPLEDESVIN